jgi:hypothetical protein
VERSVPGTPLSCRRDPPARAGRDILLRTTAPRTPDDSPPRDRIPRYRDDDYGPDAIRARQEFVREQTGSSIEHVSSYSLDPSVLPGNAWIKQNYPGELHFYLEGQFATDKKSSVVNMLHTRGKRVVAEITLPRRPSGSPDRHADRPGSLGSRAGRAQRERTQVSGSGTACRVRTRGR